VLHTRGATRPAGAERAERLAVATTPFPYTGRSDDAALLLAHRGNASLIVVAGGSDGLVAALDAGRTAMASTFLTRLEVGGRLTSAASVAQVYRPRPGRALVGAVLACQALALGTAIGSAGGPADAWDAIGSSVERTARTVADLMPGEDG
jgi:uncharacterized membrane-anchored protein